MSAKKGLGRGFDSLIPTDVIDDSFDPTASQDERVSELRNLVIDDVVPDAEQPRHEFDQDALQELADSIKEHGILQPIVVVTRAGKYQIIAGERRYRAAKMAGLKKIPALVRTVNAQHKLELSLIENIQRRDLNPLETATAYLKLKEQFNLTLEQIGKRVGGKSVSGISNTIRLLRLSEATKKEIIKGSLSEGQARPLVGVDEKIVAQILPLIIKEGWSARKIEQFIIQLKGNPVKTKKIATGDTVLQQVAQSIGKKLDIDVDIRSSAKGSGQIVLKFKNKEEFERIKNSLE